MDKHGNKRKLFWVGSEAVVAVSHAKMTKGHEPTASI